MKKIAIMQPTFIPWIGYFAMMEAADEFIILDSVAFAKRSWQQRNKLKGAQGELLITIPAITKGHYRQLIKDVEIKKNAPELRKISKTIQSYYSKAPFFSNYSQFIFNIFQNPPSKILDLNLSIIYFLMNILGISENKILKSSSMKLDSKKADLLADICQLRNAREYLSAPGSKDYISKSTSFKEKGIEVKYFEYNHPKYNQLHGEFISHIGTFDLIFNEGKNSRNIMLQGLNI